MKAVKGMLPHNKLGRAIINHLKVYKGPNHPHSAQNAKELKGLVYMSELSLYGTGRRKTSVARVFLKSGSGKISINGKHYKDYYVDSH